MAMRVGRGPSAEAIATLCFCPLERLSLGIPRRGPSDSSSIAASVSSTTRSWP